MLDSSDETLRRIGLLGEGSGDGFDRLARLAAQLCRAPVAAVSVVLPGRDWQHFRAAVGLPEPWRSLAGTPLSHSFCRLVRESGRPLAVSDARLDARVKDSPAIPDLGVAAYLGMPIHGPDGAAVGALCVVDGVTRAWTVEEEAHLAELAAGVDEQIALLAALHERNLAREEAGRAALARSRFLTSMSHEVRTPLFGVLGLAQMLEDAARDPEVRRLCEALRGSGEALLNVVNDLLDLSRLEAGRLELARAAFDPAEVAAEAAALHRPLALRKGLAFTLEADPAALPERVGDAARLRQVLHNLLGNAVKFTEAGSVRMSLAGRAGEPLRIEVSDTGPGMTPEQAARAFEPFGPAGEGAGGPEGLGLGLPLVKRLVERMGGAVALDGAPGAGVTARLSLPLPCAEAGAARGGAGPAVFDGLRVLAVDDNATNRTVLRGLLARTGAAVTLAQDGAGALELWEPGRFDVLLLDIAMPKMDGFRLLRALQAKAAAQGATPPPAIAVTASSMLEEVADYFAAGFAAHLAKPFGRGDLIREISRALRRAPA